MNPKFQRANELFLNSDDANAYTRDVKEFKQSFVAKPKRNKVKLLTDDSGEIDASVRNPPTAKLLPAGTPSPAMCGQRSHVDFGLVYSEAGFDLDDMIKKVCISRSFNTECVNHFYRLLFHRGLFYANFAIKEGWSFNSICFCDLEVLLVIIDKFVEYIGVHSFQTGYTVATPTGKVVMLHDAKERKLNMKMHFDWNRDELFLLFKHSMRGREKVYYNVKTAKTDPIWLLPYSDEEGQYERYGQHSLDRLRIEVPARDLISHHWTPVTDVHFGLTSVPKCEDIVYFCQDGAKFSSAKPFYKCTNAKQVASLPKLNRALPTQLKNKKELAKQERRRQRNVDVNGNKIIKPPNREVSIRGGVSVINPSTSIAMASKTLNGNNGEATNSDDVESFPEGKWRGSHKDLYRYRTHNECFKETLIDEFITTLNTDYVVLGDFYYGAKPPDGYDLVRSFIFVSLHIKVGSEFLHKKSGSPVFVEPRETPLSELCWVYCKKIEHNENECLHVSVSKHKKTRRLQIQSDVKSAIDAGDTELTPVYSEVSRIISSSSEQHDPEPKQQPRVKKQRAFETSKIPDLDNVKPANIVLPRKDINSEQRSLAETRRSNLNNRGCGSRSKQKNEPMAKDEFLPVEEANFSASESKIASDFESDEWFNDRAEEKVFVGMVGDELDYWEAEWIRRNADAACMPVLSPSKPPLCKCVFDNNFLPNWFDRNPDTGAPLGGINTSHIWHLFDPHHTPFCAYVCVAIAAGIECNDDFIKQLWRKRLAHPSLADMGSFHSIISYASSLGLNITFWQDDPMGNMFFENRVLGIRRRHVNSPAWRMVNLYLEAQNEDYEVEGFREDEKELFELYHAKLFIEHVGSGEHGITLQLPPPRNHRFFQDSEWRLIRCLGYLLPYSVVETNILEHLSARDDLDRRTALERRDPMRHQDMYSRMELVKTYAWFGFKFWDSKSQEFIISDVRLSQALREIEVAMSMGIEPVKAAQSVGRMSVVNTDSALTGVVANTGYVQQELAKGFTRFQISKVNTRGLLMPSANGTNIAFPGGNIINQQRAAQAGIFGNRNLISRNRVIKYKLSKPKTRYCNVAPIGAIITNSGVLTPGRFNVNDSVTLLSAFVCRSMKITYKDPVLVERFMEFSFRFLQNMLDDMTLDNLVEPYSDHDRLNYFRNHYRGKKSEEFIERIVLNHGKHLSGIIVRNHCDCGAFVKNESNLKFEGGKCFTKPRLIMTMSDEMLVELCPILELIEKWNSGPFSKYQVKDMTPEDMIAKIIKHSNTAHQVTDYSSFESSISVVFRRLENFVAMRLCDKAGFHRTKYYINKYYSGGRYLNSKYGRFFIDTRCSGDFVTSFGNGIVNVCVMAFCASLINKELSMVAEGDDGLVDITIPNVDVITRLGLSFSQSVSGNKPGDCDFLQSRWVGGRRYLNVGRCLRLLWLKKGVNLKLSKQLYLLRVSAYSLYHLSPGHPILTSLIRRIDRETKTCKNAFKYASKYLDQWGRDYTPVELREISVDETMRDVIAEGAQGFPAISVSEQLRIEHSLEFGDEMYIGSLLDHYPEVFNLSMGLRELENPEEEMEGFKRMVRGLQQAGAKIFDSDLENLY